MLSVHQWVAVAVLAVTWTAGFAAFAAYRVRRGDFVVRQLLALAQTVLVAQVGLGLLLLSDDRRSADDLHYAYGTLALLAALAPWMYAPAEPRRRLLWFGGATLLAGALAVRAYMTAG
jgi:multisubunit Na+/H+ antiporter MnhF subunit